MTQARTTDGTERVVSAQLVVRAPAEAIFELVVEPSVQPRWDGNDNLASAEPGQRPVSVGDVFSTTLTGGSVRENHVVELDPPRLVAWRPSVPGEPPPGHLWRWELEPLDDGSTRVSHTYDWTDLHDESRLERARSTTPDKLRASLDRLAALAEGRSPDA